MDPNEHMSWNADAPREAERTPAASDAEVAFWSAIASGVEGADQLGHDEFVRQLDRTR